MKIFMTHLSSSKTILAVGRWKGWGKRATWDRQVYIRMDGAWYHFDVPYDIMVSPKYKEFMPVYRLYKPVHTGMSEWLTGEVKRLDEVKYYPIGSVPEKLMKERPYPPDPKWDPLFNFIGWTVGIILFTILVWSFWETLDATTAFARWLSARF